MPDGHGIVEADFPRGKQYVSCIVILCIYHLARFPKLIKIGLGFSVSEPKFTSDDINSEFRHEFAEVIGEWICFLIKWGDTPKILSLPSRSGGH